MVLVLKYLYKSYNEIVKSRDDRIDDFILMGSPFKLLTLLGIYLYFIYRLGPKIMKDRKPFELNRVLQIYNLFQVLANLILWILAIYVFISRNYSLKCGLVNYERTAEGYFQAYLSYSYFMLKVSDLLDTVFFVLRKRQRQVSFLHVYHHSAMTIMAYYGTQYVPGGHVALLGIFNCFIHAVMYFYYFLTSFKPELKNSIWWKKYITQIQLIQFVILTVHFGHPLIIGNCQFPKAWLFLGVIQNLYMIVMFSDFYIKTYIKKPKNIKYNL